jgi:hypothetical protein
MNNYLVLYRSEAALDGPSISEMFANAPKDQLEAGMALWVAWIEKCGIALVSPGAPLDKPTVMKAGTAAPARSSITGYAIIQAESIEAATELLKDHPHFHAPGASIEFLECVQMPGP